MRVDQSSQGYGEVVLHFDVDSNSIPLWHFVEAARAVEEIIASFNRDLFEDRLEFEIRVLPSQRGSLIEVLGLWIGGASATAWMFIESDIGKGFIKGLTGKEPFEIAEDIGQAIRHAATKKSSSLSDTTVEAEIDIDHKKIGTKQLVAATLVLMVVSVLKSDTSDLHKVGIPQRIGSGAYQGRDRFYQAALKNNELKGIGFGREELFEVERPNFILRTANAQDHYFRFFDEPGLPVARVLGFETVDILVHSPNWQRHGRKWQGSSERHKRFNFKIEDEEFWRRLDHEGLPLKAPDTMRVQMVFEEGARGLVNVQVLRVLNFNGVQLTTPLGEAELESLLINRGQLRLHSPR